MIFSFPTFPKAFVKIYLSSRPKRKCAKRRDLFMALCACNSQFVQRWRMAGFHHCTHCVRFGRNDNTVNYVFCTNTPQRVAYGENGRRGGGCRLQPPPRSYMQKVLCSQLMAVKPCVRHEHAPRNGFTRLRKPGHRLRVQFAAFGNYIQPAFGYGGAGVVIVIVIGNRNRLHLVYGCSVKVQQYISAAL